MRKLIYAGLILIVFILAGFFVPLGSYTTRNGCQLDTTPTARLHLIKGDSLNKVKNRKPSPYEGCALNTKYVLYFL